ncbi:MULTISPECIES: YicC/YloC family endoribonuclease [Rubrivivax]|uniref:YicC/YloC family endoribonuclease n=1 Tax=Rubrivivax TaxID=28067 RepID=UPI0009DB9681|nr:MULTISPECIES: YicC/YloC family endoribonuclease [Rubrivivax]MCC9598300.1 YicC family protein [Rubrivivax sp. JA1055]MCC9645444.1 YicC family protein [Rubrivivax sp. JA1029]MCD0417594.1 YicC family protein [Rubrivivax sp. JA1024]
MAVYSMTGYANAASAPAGDGGAASSVSVEARSVNGRFLDLSFRMPDDLRGLEPALRDLLGTAFRRGKIEMRISAQRDSDSAWPNPNPEQLNRLLRLESSVQGWMPQARGLSVNEVLQWCRNGAGGERLDEAALEAARQCIEGLKDARAREGKRLVAMLMDRLGKLRELADKAEPLVPQVVQRQQQRFLERWNEALAGANAGNSVPAATLQERAMAEAAAFAIRIDVAEELTRLRSHLDEIERLLKKGGELGKRLDFLIQELQREANTLGSKSPAIELTAISVEMKVLVEQMREQVQNIE